MNQFLLSIALLVAYLPGLAQPNLCRGTVTCDNRALAGVVVTDGVHCTATDTRGEFSLPMSENARFVYLSTPADYTSPVDEGLERFYLMVDASRESYDFVLQRKSKDETRHGFVVVADPQLYAQQEFALLERAASDIRQTAADAARPLHGICVGDITSGNHDFYTRYNQIMASTGLKFRNSMGNHDMKLWGRSYETSVGAYERVFGPAHYSYNIGRVHYVVLNDNFYIGRDWYYIGYLDERQLAWLQQDLSYMQPGTTVVVALHIPTALDGKAEEPFAYERAERLLCNRKALYELLSPYRAHILSGHMHTNSNTPISANLYEHNIAALSGAWWQGEVCTDGTPAGYAVFYVDAGELSWYYQATGFPSDYQMRVYTRQDLPSLADQILVNVWNYDPAWTVAMRVDGGQPIPMTQTAAFDPVAQSSYADASKLVHRWISATSASHFFTAPIPSKARSVEVIVTDRFGRLYTIKRSL